MYGISSPIPTWYTEELIAAELEEKTSARMLLDVIHQRLYSSLYQSSTKYQLLQKVVEEQSPQYLDVLFDLTGIPRKSVGESFPSPNRLLRYIGLFRQKPRSAEGLKVILEDALRRVQVEIHQCIGRTVKIPEFQRLALGIVGNHLGVDSIVGEELEDHTGKILISIGPVPLERFHQLLNGSPECRTLIFLIEAYINVPIDCDLEIILEENEAKTAQLGVPEFSCLGKNAWIFSGEGSESLRAQLSFSFSKEVIPQEAA